MFFQKKSKIPGLSLGLESQAVPRILAVPKSSHGTQIPGTLGTGTKIVGTVPGFSALGLKSQGQKSLGLAVPSHAHSWAQLRITVGNLLIASTLENHSHPHRLLTDKLDTFLESSDNV